MADILETLRHPDFKDVSTIWRTVSANVNLDELSTISAIPSLPTKAELGSYGGIVDRDLNGLYRPIVLAGAIRALGKSLEAFENAEACRALGATSSSLLLYYDANYLAGRSLVMLLGFAQISRESDVCVDVFAQAQGARNTLAEEVARFFVYGRWGHENVWKLLARLLRTTKRRQQIDLSLKHFRSDKLSAFSRPRNLQIYSDIHMYGGDDPDEGDFPDNVSIEYQVPTICKRYREAFDHLMVLIFDIVNAAKLHDILGVVAAPRRISAWQT